MNCDYFVELFKRIFFHGNHRTVMPRVVHQDIDPAEFFSRRCDHTQAIAVLRQVRWSISCPATTAGYLRCGCAEFLFGSRREKHRGTLLREDLCDGPANASA